MLDREERGDDKPLKTRDKEIHSSLVKRMKPLPYHLQPLTVSQSQLQAKELDSRKTVLINSSALLYIQVALRVRPMNHSEIRTGARIAAQTVDQNVNS